MLERCRKYPGNACLALVVALLGLCGCNATNTRQADSVDGSGNDWEQVERYILVTLRPERNESREQLADELAVEFDLQRVRAWKLSTLGVHCIVFAVPPRQNLDGITATLQDDFRVESVQPMQRHRTTADPYHLLQKDTMLTPGRTRAFGNASGHGVDIAVIDTGVDIQHPDLGGAVELAQDFVSDLDAVPAEFHGTAVAGIIAAQANNGEGIHGIAPESRIWSLRACWQQELSAGICNTFTLALALNFAVAEGVDIINLSLSGPRDPLLERLVAEAQRRDIVVVGAAATKAKQFPGSVSGVLAVADLAAETPAHTAHLHLNGKDVVTTVPGGRYDFVSGHSVATAIGSALTALLLQRGDNREPGLLAESLRRLASN